MITDEGKIWIKRFMAGQVPAIASSIAFGIGDSAETVGDERLHLEIDRSDIVLTSYDFVNDKLIFKAPIPDFYSGKIYEVAIYSTPENSSAGNFGSKLISSFDEDSEEWITDGVEPVYVVTPARVGGDALRHTAPLSTTVSSVLTDLEVDLSGNSDSDIFLVAINNTNTNAANVKVKLKTDDSNYYTLTITTPVAGYSINEITKGAAAATGSPSWADINSIEVTNTANASGTSTVDFDALRIEDTDTINPDYVLVAREVLPVPYVKQEGMVQDIEYSLDITI